VPLFNPQSSIINPQSQDWVRFARFTPRPICQLPLPTQPSPPKFGFVLHDFLRRRPPGGRNWVCFAHSALRPGPNWVRFAHLASGIRPRPNEIGFVLRHSPPQRPALLVGWAMPTICPGREIGFVLRISPPARLRPGPNWVRFARFAPETGCVLHGCRQPSSPTGFSAIRNPQSAIVGPPTPKLGLFCTFHSPAEPRPTRHSMPRYPRCPTFGFVLHNLLRQPPRPGEIGFVSRASLAGRGQAHTTCFAQIPQVPQVWLCFA
jgi:hypothetical protein